MVGILGLSLDASLCDVLENKEEIAVFRNDGAHNAGIASIYNALCTKRWYESLVITPIIRSSVIQRNANTWLPLPAAVFNPWREVFLLFFPPLVVFFEKRFRSGHAKAGDSLGDNFSTHRIAEVANREQLPGE